MSKFKLTRRETGIALGAVAIAEGIVALVGPQYAGIFQALFSALFQGGVQ